MIIASLVPKSIAKLVAPTNSIATLDCMVKKSTTLEDWQIADAARLKRLFEDRKPKISQMQFGADFGIGVQGMVWQYLSGMRPLNIDAAMKFSAGLEVPIDQFSENIARQVEAAFKLTAKGMSPAATIPSAFAKLNIEQQRAVAGIIETMGVKIEPSVVVGDVDQIIVTAGKKQSSQSG